METELMGKKLKPFERKKLQRQLPKIPQERKSLFKIVKTTEYELMKKSMERQTSYLTQIMDQFVEIKNMKEELQKINAMLKIKETKRRKSASKIGGLQASLNSQRQKNDVLLEMLKEKDIELDVKEKEVEMLRNKGKRKKNVESYKNYFEARKELEKKEINEWFSKNGFKG